MHRPILTCVFLVLGAATLHAQQSDPYQGVSHPPADDTITASEPEQAKPPAGKPLGTPAQASQPAPQPVQPAAPPPSPRQPESVSGSDEWHQADGTDDGIVEVAPPDPRDTHTAAAPGLNTREDMIPDGDIVRLGPLHPGELAEGTIIRVRLLTGLSTSSSQSGDVFRSRVASDVLQDGNVLIPAGAEIDGRVVDVSEGHAGGHGSIRLRPDTVILENGQRFRMDALVTGAPGTNTNVNGEGTIEAGSRWKKDGMWYGGGVGAGAVTGAAVGGPVGALAGSLIGAGAVTVHLLSDHPQADLEPGTVLLITLDKRLNLVATNTASN